MKKTVFFFELQNESGTDHLWIVLSDPDAEDNVMIVNAASVKTGREDESCKLPGGCHPNITRDSYIAYRYAQKISIYRINYLENLNRLTRKASFSDRWFQLIQDGAKASPLLPEGFEKFFDFF